MSYYNKFSKNTFSQNGEDGIIEKLFEELNLNTESLFICEYGAHNGIHCSNSRKWLLENKAKCLLIESNNYNPNLFLELVNNSSSYGAICVNSKVGNPDYNIEYTPLHSILKINNFPEDFDLLSVDIDGEDHLSVRTKENYNPKIIIIEINSGKNLYENLPLDVNMDQGGMNFGSSIKYMNEIGYDAVCHTGNMIYVRKDLTNKLSIPIELINSENLYTGNK